MCHGATLLLGIGVDLSNENVIKYFRLATDQGHSAAQNHLGVMYQYGYGVPLDYGMAFKYYQLAADQCNAAGQNSLGGMYCDGVVKDEAMSNTTSSQLTKAILLVKTILVSCTDMVREW